MINNIGNRKVKRIISEPTPVDPTNNINNSVEYVGPFIIIEDSLNRIRSDGGYCTVSGNQAEYHYYVRDHLGSNRIVVDEEGTIEQKTYYYPFGGIYGDVGTNTDVQSYKYNGKELDHRHGLDLYDYGARMYDPVVGSWISMDPLAEKYYNVSPYAYCHNNPINRYDLDGKDDYFSNTGRFLYTRGDGANMYVMLKKGYVNLSDLNLRYARNRHIAANIVGYYAKAVGIRYNLNGGTGTVGVSTLHVTDGEGRVLAGTTNHNIFIKMINGKLDPLLYNLHNLKGTLIHENEHKLDQDKGIIESTSQRHVDIILKEMSNEDFGLGGTDYQEGQIGQLLYYLNDNNNTERTEQKKKANILLKPLGYYIIGDKWKGYSYEKR